MLVSEVHVYASAAPCSELPLEVIEVLDVGSNHQRAEIFFALNGVMTLPRSDLRSTVFADEGPIATEVVIEANVAAGHGRSLRPLQLGILFWGEVDEDAAQMPVPKRVFEVDDVLAVTPMHEFAKFIRAVQHEVASLQRGRGAHRHGAVPVGEVNVIPISEMAEIEECPRHPEIVFLCVVNHLAVELHRDETGELDGSSLKKGLHATCLWGYSCVQAESSLWGCVEAPLGNCTEGEAILDWHLMKGAA